jgi:hypothetical protein
MINQNLREKKIANKSELENRIIPYKMLYESVSSTHGLLEGILSDSGIPSLRIRVKLLKSVMEEYIQIAREGLPIIGHHFLFPQNISPVLTVFQYISKQYRIYWHYYYLIALNHIMI